MSHHPNLSGLIKNVFAIFIVTLFLAGCMQVDTLTGGSGSTTTNGFTASIRTSEGTVVSQAEVRIRPNDYLVPVYGKSAFESGGTVADTVTDSNGTITFFNVDPGNYSIEIKDPLTGYGSLISGTIDSSGIYDFGERIIVPAGAIKGVIDTARADGASSYSVLVYGVERSVRVDRTTGAFIIPDLPPANYIVRLVSLDTHVVPIDYEEVTVRSLDTIDVDPFAAWSHDGTATITMGRHPMMVGNSLYYFPLLLRLDSNNFDFSTAKKKGEDVRITKTNGKSVAFEIERWDSRNATATLWILIDTLYNMDIKQSVDLHWGNPKASTKSHPSAVFDTAFGYRGVWHFNESGGKMQYDATVKGTNGTPFGMDGANDVIGIAGRAQMFEKGDSQYIVIDSVSGKFVKNGITVSTWVLRNNSMGHPQGIVLWKNLQFGLMLDSDDRWVLYDSGAALVSVAATEDEWTLLTAVRNKSKSYLYVNGEIIDSVDSPNKLPANSENRQTLLIGCLNDSTGWFEGIIDEVRLYDYAVSASWIRMNYEIERKDQTVVSFVKR